jgi:hypothetical protein
MDEKKRENLNEYYGDRLTIDYTFNLKINSTPDATQIYFPVNSIKEFELLMTEWKQFKSDTLQAGRVLKDSLLAMNITQLENFTDTR